MDSIFEVIISFVTEVVKFLFYILIWSYILFYLGLISLKIITLGRYPIGLQINKHTNVISGVGVTIILIFWSFISTYNFSENYYFLIVSVCILIIQLTLIWRKYSLQYRGERYDNKC